MSNEQITQADLKVMALKEAIAEANEKIADLRVEVTVLGQRLQTVMAENDELRKFKEEHDGAIQQEAAGPEDEESS